LLRKALKVHLPCRISGNEVRLPLKAKLTKDSPKYVLPLSVMYVEDELVILRSITTMMKLKIREVYVAQNGEIGLEIFKKHRPQIVITDIKMPVMDGLEMIERIKKIDPTTKFIIVSAYGETNYFIRAIELSVHGFILKPVNVNQLMEVIMELGNGILLHHEIERKEEERKKSAKALREQKVYFERLFESSPEAVVIAQNNGKILQINRTFSDMFGFTNEEAVGATIDELISSEELLNEARELTNQVAEGNDIEMEAKRKMKNGELLDVSILGRPIIVDGKQVAVYGIYRDITDRKKAEDELKESYRRLQKLIQDTVNVLANVVELRDPYTAGHQHNVAQLGVAIAQGMGCSEDMIEGIRIGGTMHDIGKIKVPIRILNKSEMLTDNEWEQIKNHPSVGYELLKDLDFPWQVAKMVLQHHERFNGSGYPNGLKNGEILMEARILAVADVIEAMANDRPYRQSLGLEIALEEIEDNKGILYDPEVVENAVKILKEGSFEFIKRHT